MRAETDHFTVRKLFGFSLRERASSRPESLGVRMAAARDAEG
ncbi:hypothetical protein SBD_0260 [Streptomyces bottropensis ATCC 25435]|uniref:Uncharacterized protein n=1 Tax=Streptomyces bottropensis ATCC 25435 TaxID=1054862 RepID=M3F7G7_9ACTN|nr:hypothetical protein SBD_0260 [Streptomyces bottropensis ATCC 25435]